MMGLSQLMDDGYQSSNEMGLQSIIQSTTCDRLESIIHSMTWDGLQSIMHSSNVMDYSQ